MLALTQHITIGEKKRKLKHVLSVQLDKSMEQLADTATIEVNAAVHGKALEVEKDIYRGQPIAIQLGYDDQNHTELEGFITSVATNNGILKIACEDHMNTLRTPVKDTQLKDTDLVSIVKNVVGQANPTLAIVPADGIEGITFTTFDVANATAFQVLQKLQQQTGTLFYIRSHGLYIAFRYLQDSYAQEKTKLRLHFNKNIEAHTLTYMKAEERKLRITVVGSDKQNRQTRVSEGETGGDTLTIHRYGVDDLSTLQNMATEELKKYSYEGYTGNLTTWLTPYATYGMKAELTDPQYPDRQGTYLIERVQTSFSQQGGKRTLYLSKRV